MWCHPTPGRSIRLDDEVFMMRVFDEAAVQGVGGVVFYAQAFADAV